MTSYLPMTIEMLLSGQVESTRLELKARWDEKTTGWQILKTLCAFANDLHNLNGGYIVLGIEEADGVAVRPVRGIPLDEIDDIQKRIRGRCQQLDPVCLPVFEPQKIDGQHVLVMFAPASDNRPHQVPDGEKGERRFFVRIGSESVVAKNEVRTQLIQQTQRIPFDDRRAHDATNHDLRLTLVREFLRDVQPVGPVSPGSFAACTKMAPPNPSSTLTRTGLTFE